MISPARRIGLALVAAGLGGLAAWSAWSYTSEGPSQPAVRAGSARDDGVALQTWTRRNLLEGYRRAGRRGSACDPTAELFLSEALPAFSNLAPWRTAALLGRAREAVARGCDDAVVSYLAGLVLLNNDERDRAGELFEKAMTAVQNQAYSRGVARLVASALRRDLTGRAEGVGRRAALDPVELRWFVESLADGSYEAEEDVVLANALTRGTGASLLDRNAAAVATAVEATGWVDPWLKLLVKGARAEREAWTARGNQYANKVTEEGWKGFNRGMEAARAAYLASWTIRPDRPEAATGLLRVAMTGATDDRDTRGWFDRAVAGQIDYLPAYDQMITASRARWGGDPEALQALARQWYETRRFDTDVPLMALEALLQMEWDVADAATPPAEPRDIAATRRTMPSIFRRPEIHAIAAGVLDGYSREPSRFGERDRFEAYYAAVEYKAGRFSEARRHLRNAGLKVSGEAEDAIPDRMPAGRIEAFGAPGGDEVVKAEELFLAGRLDEAGAAFKGARAGASPAAAEFLDQRLAVIGVERGLRQGEVVSLLPAAGLGGWLPENGAWSVTADGALEVVSGLRGHLATHEARVGGDFEFSVEIEIASTSNGQFQAGVVFGKPEWRSSRWTSFRLKRTSHEGPVVYFSRHFNAPVRSLPFVAAERNRLVVRSLAGRLGAWIDDKALVTDYAAEWEWERGSEARVGLGGYVDDNRLVVRYRNPKVRRLQAVASR